MTMPRLLCALICLLLTNTASAARDTLPWEGVWRGTIGDREAIVCLFMDNAGYGDYYFLDDALSVALVNRTLDGTWLELPWTSRFGTPAPSLRLNQVSADILAGQR